MDAIVVGIDISKNQLDIHVRGHGGFVVPRDAEGLAALIDRVRPLAPHLVGMEATGGFETFVAAGLASAGLPVVVVNPAQVRAFANALGKRAKTDPIDAAVDCKDSRSFHLLEEGGDAAELWHDSWLEPGSVVIDDEAAKPFMDHIPYFHVSF